MEKIWVLIQNGVVRPEATRQAETKPPIAASKGEYKEQVLAVPPEILPTQKRIESWEVVDEQYIQSWEVVDKTPLEMWHFPEYCKRIIAPIQLIFDPSGVGLTMKARFDLDKLPIEKEGDTVYVYAKIIYAEDQAIIDQLEGMISIEDRPNE